MLGVNLADTKVAKYIADKESKTQVCMKDASVTAIVNAMPEFVLKSTKSSICPYPAVQAMKSPRLSEHTAEGSPAKVFKLTWLPTVSLHPYYAPGDGMVPQVKASSVSVAPKVYRGSSHPRPLHTNYWVDYRPAKDRHMRQDDVWFLICYFDCEAWNLRRTKIKTMLDGVITTKVAKYISDKESKTQVCMKDASVTAIVNAMSDLVLESTKLSICSYPVQNMKSPHLSEHPAEGSPAKVFKLTWLPTVSLHPYYAPGDGMVPQVKASTVSAAPKVYRGSSHPRPLHTNYWVDYRPAKEWHMRRDDLWVLHCYFCRKSWKSRKMEIKAMLDGVVATKVAQYISDNEDKRQVCMKDISVTAIVNVPSAPLELNKTTK